MLIIGFGHKARRGKDSAVNAIIAARGGQYDIRRYAFADVLKQEVNAAAMAAGGMLELFKLGGIREGASFTPFPEWLQYDVDADMSDPLCPLGKQRKLLQWYGSEFRRSQSPFYWVRALFKNINRDKPQVALVADMRFFNEMYAIKEQRPDRAGFAIRLDRTGFADEGTNRGHQSENQLDEAEVDGKQYDFAITVQDGDIEELLKDAIRVFDMIVESLQMPSAADFTLESIEGAEREGREAVAQFVREMQA